MIKKKNYIFAAIGVMVIILGLYLINAVEEPQAFMIALPYVCIGVGSGAFGYGVSNIVSAKLMARNPDMQKRIEISSHDERNMMIADRAKAKAYNLMIFVFGALMIAFALMGVDVVPVLFFVAAYLCVQGYAVYCRCKYEKEM